MTATIDTPPVPDEGGEDRALDPAFLEIEMLDSGAGVARPGRIRGVRDVFRGWAELGKTPYGLTPAVVLALIYGVQAIDSAAFNFAGPVFVRERGIEIPKIINIISVIGFVTIFANLGIGYLLERRKRLPVLLSGAVFQGAATCFTGYAHSAAALGSVRASATSVGDASSVPSFSLLADYYPPEVRGRLFSLLGVVFQVAALLAPPLAGAGLVFLGLETTFVIGGSLIVAAAVIGMVKLREPVRGYFERRTAGLDEAQSDVEDEPLSFGEAARTIFAVRTVRRIFAAQVVGGLGQASGLFTIFLLSQEYGLGTFGLVLYGTPPILAAIVAGAIGGQYVDRLIARNPARTLTLFGAFTATSAIGTFMLASTPPIYVLILFSVMVAAGGAFIGPAEQALITQVIPPNSRTLGIQFLGLASSFRYLFFAPFLGMLFATNGFVPIYLIGGVSFLGAAVIQVTIGSLFDLDRRNSLASASAGQKWEQAKVSGEATLLNCDGVNVSYDGIQTLFDIDFRVDEGECVALLGTNGAGKSTLLRAIAGIQEADGGAIVVSGRDLTHMPPHEIARRNVIFMPGGRGTFPELTVKENLLLAGWADPEEATEGGLAEVLEIFPRLVERYDSPAGVLSGGEQQQLALAQAFLQKPKLLMIDELSLGLAPAIVGQLIEIVKEINRRGIAVIVVEQSVTVALELAKRAVYMEKGRIRFDGPIPELMQRSDILRAIYVTGGAGGAVGSRGSAARAESLYGPGSKVVLEVKNLSKEFGGIRAVNDVSLPLYEGQVLGLIGPNGSGKTTLFDMISGFIPPSGGTVEMRGEDITDLSPDERARKGLVRRFQDARLFPSLTVTETILISLEKQYGAKSALLAGIGSPRSRRSEKTARAKADQLLALLELGRYRDTLVGELSTGLRRIVDLACVLATEPEVLLLDEPSTGVAQAEAEGLAPLLRRVQREAGCSILIIEHDINLLKAVADEFAALNLGSLIARGAPEDVLNDPLVLEAYIGTSEAAANRSGGNP